MGYAQEIDQLYSESTDIFNILEKISDFRDCDQNALRKLAQSGHLIDYEAKQIITFEGDSEFSGYFIASGRVALVKASPCGKDLAVEFLFPGDLFGMLATLERRNCPFTIRSETKSRVISFPHFEVLEFLDQHSELSKNLLKEVFDKLCNSHDFARALAYDRVEIRITNVLVYLACKSTNKDSSSSVISIEMSRQEMADYVGTTVETVIRTMKVMEKNQLIDLSEVGYVRILDLEGLCDLTDLIK